MKKAIWVIILILTVLNFPQSSHSIIIRSMGGMGYSFVNSGRIDQQPSLYHSSDNYSYGLVLQGIVDFFEYTSFTIGFGFDIGYHYLWNYTNEADGEKISYKTYHFSFLSEAKFYELFVLQIGIGYYGDGGNYSSMMLRSARMGDSFGIMMGAGIEVTLLDNLMSIPFLLRTDFIFGQTYWENGYSSGGTIIPVKLMTGVTIRL